MTYQQTLDFLYTRLPMFSRIGAAAIKKDLHNTVALCESLGNPHHRFKCIHVAGTNGKGSVSHMLAGILQTAGYKTGLYTSPHLQDFRERIRINGIMVDETFVTEFTERMIPLIEQLEPSFFEITVAMAFEWFAQQQVDVAVIETGLGGRLDSTNVVTPELSIITNIGWDHMALLGSTLPAIATEKAGIIKENVPVIVGETTAATKPVFLHTAAFQKAPLLFAEEEWQISSCHLAENVLSVVLKEQTGTQSNTYELDLKGFYQAKNLRTVLSAVQQLRKRGWNITETKLRHALLHIQQLTGLRGRWQLVRRNPTLVLDVGHNEDGMRQIVQQLQQTAFDKLQIILGMVKDKEIEQALSLLPHEATYYFTQAHLPRALPAAELAEKAATAGLRGTIFENVNDAIQAALQQAGANDLVLVCGSVFLVGEVSVEAFQEAGKI